MGYVRILVGHDGVEAAFAAVGVAVAPVDVAPAGVAPVDVAGGAPAAAA